MVACREPRRCPRGSLFPVSRTPTSVGGCKAHNKPSRARVGLTGVSVAEHLSLRRPIYRLILSVWAVGIAAWIGILHYADWPVWRYPGFLSGSTLDSAAFAYIGELLRHGARPYIDYWDHKPPLVHLINAGGLILS